MQLQIHYNARYVRVKTEREKDQLQGSKRLNKIEQIIKKKKKLIDENEEFD